MSVREEPLKKLRYYLLLFGLSVVVALIARVLTDTLWRYPSKFSEVGAILLESLAPFAISSFFLWKNRQIAAYSSLIILAVLMVYFGARQ